MRFMTMLVMLIAVNGAARAEAPRVDLHDVLKMETVLVRYDAARVAGDALERNVIEAALRLELAREVGTPLPPGARMRQIAVALKALSGRDDEVSVARKRT